MPLLLGENEFDSLRLIFWHFPIYLQSTNNRFKDGRDMYFRTRPGSVLRAGKWKLHVTQKTGLELYDLENDISESENLADANPEVVARLQTLMEAYDRDLKANTRPMWQAEGAEVPSQKRAKQGKRKKKE